MHDSPEPLDAGTMLAGRFELAGVLGRGGFGIAYLATDTERRDECVIKELAPAGCVRLEDGVLKLATDGSVGAQRLRQRFLEEARVLSKLDLPGVLPVRAAFHENGTAYFATAYLVDSSTLDRLIRQEGRLDAAGALDILFQLVETLGGVHRAGILHRDIKPSNILLDPKGRTYLIDFGAAREWHADSETSHTVLFTPGYAPIEQLAERAQRGPATDIYALCATVYHMLVGEPPPRSTDRAAGTPLPSLRRLRPDIEPAVIDAIEKGLALRYADRPQTVEDLQRLMSTSPDEGEVADPITEFDEKAFKLQRFSFAKRQCPACGGLLESPKPLKRGVCPVCLEGTIRQRKSVERLCPICRAGMLRARANDRPLLFCPVCRTGILAKKRKSILGKDLVLTCQACAAVLETDGDGLSLRSAGNGESQLALDRPMSPAQWRAACNRAADVWLCDGCEAQFDLQRDGRRLLITPAGKRQWTSLYPEEWARVADGLDPGAGNAECDVCGADYFLEGERVTLLGAHRDPHAFSAHHAGRLLTLSDLQWLGVGKESPQPGFVCSGCGTEFDELPEGLRLVHTRSAALVHHGSDVLDLKDWCRVGQGLPTSAREDAFQMAFDEAIVDAYEQGRIPFESRGKADELWNSPATRLAWDDGEWLDDGAGRLSVTTSQVTFGGLIRKAKLPLGDVKNVSAEEDRLIIELRDGSRTAFQIPEVELTLSLKSGRRAVRLGAGALARRIGGPPSQA
jgi:predicted Ser/Thr protein kinase